MIGTDMPLNDYSYVLTVGSNCTPVWQLRLAAERLGMSIDRVKGPFDWLLVPLHSAVDALNNGFRGFFRPEESRIVGTIGDRHLHVLNRHGFHSLHNFSAEQGTSSLSAEAWERWDKNQGQRIAACEAALADPNGNVLVVRLANPGWPDDPETVELLATGIASRSLAAVTVAAVAFGAPQTHHHPLVRTFGVERSWPHDLPNELLDWGRDYGWGVAWEGHTESWNRVWQQV